MPIMSLLLSKATLLLTVNCKIDLLCNNFVCLYRHGVCDVITAEKDIFCRKNSVDTAKSSHPLQGRLWASSDYSRIANAVEAALALWLSRRRGSSAEIWPPMPAAQRCCHCLASDRPNRIAFRQRGAQYSPYALIFATGITASRWPHRERIDLVILTRMPEQCL